MKFRVTGPAALLVLAIQLALWAWFIYLTIKIAAHVGAWPF